MIGKQIIIRVGHGIFRNEKVGSHKKKYQREGGCFVATYMVDNDKT